MDKMLINFFSKNYPLLKIFEYGEDFLIYDAKPNFAFLISKTETNLLLKFLETKDKNIAINSQTELDIKEANILVNKYAELIDCGVFIPDSVDEISPTNKEEIEKLINYYDKYVLPQKFVLEVTEDCNFRCTYCPNTINTEYRKHSKNNMTLETAKNAINYYFERYIKIFNLLSKEKKELLLNTVPPTLSWYGGEPFLNFDLIKESSEYFKNMNWEKEGISKEYLTYSSNSNLSILNSEILFFLVNNDVLLYVSIDGPKSEHDKCRIFSNGKGTFETVYTNLMKIKEFNEEYYNKRVNILAVEADCYNIEECAIFFGKEKFASLTISPQEHTNCFYQNPMEIYSILQEEKNKKIKEICKDIDEADTQKNVEDNLEALFDYIEVVEDKPVGENFLNILLSCPMGIDNNMIGVNGDIHICHKTDGSMPFGNVNESPILYDSLVNLYYKYNQCINMDLCKKCWALRFCKICAAKRLKNNEFKNPLEVECQIERIKHEIMFNGFLYATRKRMDLIEYFRIKKVIDILIYLL